MTAGGRGGADPHRCGGQCIPHQRRSGTQAEDLEGFLHGARPVAAGTVGALAGHTLPLLPATSLSSATVKRGSPGHL